MATPREVAQMLESATNKQEGEQGGAGCIA